MSTLGKALNFGLRLNTYSLFSEARRKRETQSMTAKGCVGGGSQTRVYACPSIGLLECQSHMAEGLCVMGYRQEKTKQG